MIVGKSYRKGIHTQRFSPFVVCHRNTDIWVGIDHTSADGLNLEEMRGFILSRVIEAWELLERYAGTNQRFFPSLEPIDDDPAAPPLVRHMIAAGLRAGTGPMASVAAAVAFYAFDACSRQYQVRELIMENGGDILVTCKKELVVSVFAGSSSLSEKIRVHLPPTEKIVGICCSSGTVGHSFSFGAADAVMVAAHDPLQADAWATSFCNQVHGEDDVNRVIEKMREIPEITSAVVAIGDTAGICGDYRITFSE